MSAERTAFLCGGLWGGGETTAPSKRLSTHEHNYGRKGKYRGKKKKRRRRKGVPDHNMTGTSCNYVSENSQPSITDSVAPSPKGAPPPFPDSSTGGPGFSVVPAGVTRQPITRSWAAGGLNERREMGAVESRPYYWRVCVRWLAKDGVTGCKLSPDLGALVIEYVMHTARK